MQLCVEAPVPSQSKAGNLSRTGWHNAALPLANQSFFVFQPLVRGPDSPPSLKSK